MESKTDLSQPPKKTEIHAPKDTTISTVTPEEMPIPEKPNTGGTTER